MKNIILLGAPGSGKGTQSDFLIANLGYTHISTGDIIRDAISAQSPEGMLCKQYANEGKLVPDELMIAMVEQYLASIKSNIVWDGFPRTVAQADALHNLLGKHHDRIDSVLLMDISQDKLMERITGRLSCPQCKKTYHRVFQPPKVDGICDQCHAKLVQREDDTAAKAGVRLAAYNEQTAPLIDYYRRQHKLIVINADQKTEQVWRDVCEALHD